MKEQGHTRIFQTKVFARLSKVEGVDAAALTGCIGDAEMGLIDAHLGRGLIKQRLARTGQGKSGGLRTVLIFHKGDRAIFLDIFAKKDKANFSDEELRGYKKLAAVLSGWTEQQLSEAVRAGKLIEIKRRDEAKHGKEAR